MSEKDERAFVASTAGDRAALVKLLARVNAAAGYPKDGVDRGCGVHPPAAKSRTTGYTLRTHPRTAERAIVLEKPALRAAVAHVTAGVAERIAAGKADADDLAIAAFTETTLASDWRRAEVTARTRDGSEKRSP